jgi:ornithine cyclodeaminase
MAALQRLVKEHRMIVISEQDARRLVGMRDAIPAVEEAFTRIATDHARNYPVVRESVGLRDGVFGIKSGVGALAPLLGLKAGGYWPHNAQQGLTNHQSSTLLFDPRTGQAEALVSANHLTGVRTGAAAALATRHLSRPDSETLGIIGTGVQAVYQFEAMRAVRPIRRVLAWSPATEQVLAFGRIVEQLDIAFEAKEAPREVAAFCDVLVTVTPSQRPIVEKGWIRPGTHVNAMGADTRGKQEFAQEVIANAALFTDEIQQALTIGEFQHAYANGLLEREDIRGTLGEVIAGACPGRLGEDEITFFDGTGVALQDLAVARLAVQLALEKGGGSRVQY